jgi:hypothetical protein
MMSSVSINSPLFLTVFYVLVIALAALADYPNQKYTLFTRTPPKGYIMKVATFCEPISEERAISLFGRRLLQES